MVWSRAFDVGRQRPGPALALLLVLLVAAGVQGVEGASSTAEGGEGSHGSSVFSGLDPTIVQPSKPIVLIVIQLSLIILLSRLLAFFGSKLRQPRVVSEILAGILLGPTAFGRIPGFTEHIFPTASITYLTLLSEVGLVLFLFCVGMEADMGLLKRNLRPGTAVSISGLAIPFGIGCAVSVGLFKQFGAEDVKFTTFMTFIGTSSSITALPVLARILGEIGLMQDRVGLVALASGVVNDIIGWALLALSIALASAGNGVTVVYILLTLAGWMLFLTFAVRPLLILLARRTGSYGPNGPTQNFVCFCLVLVLVSAMFSECIGISAILGGFLAGLIIPAEFCHPLTTKIEDVVSCILVPLYFATSGLSTNLTLLNSGVIWGWTICVIVCAFAGKFGGCTLASLATGFSFRESCAVGSLMSAKGLIELIVLNQGLQAGIISETVFSIFVLEALLLTIAATPLTLAFYPQHLRQPSSHPPNHGAHPHPAGGEGKTSSAPSVSSGKGGASHSDVKERNSGESPFRSRTRFTVVLDQLESLGATMVFTHLFSAVSSSSSSSSLDAKEMGTAGTGDTTLDNGDGGGDLGLTPPSSTTEETTLDSSAPLASSPHPVTTKNRTKGNRTVSLTPLRLVELTDRTSSTLLATASPAQLLAVDPIVGLFRTFTSLFSSSSSSSRTSGGVKVEMERADLKVEQQDQWAEVVVRKANREEDEVVVVGWKVGGTGGGGGGVGAQGAATVVEATEGEATLPNPFSHLFPSSHTTSQPPPSPSSASPLKRPSLAIAPTSSISLPNINSPSALSPSTSLANLHQLPNAAAGPAPRFASFLRSLFREAAGEGMDVIVAIDRSATTSLAPGEGGEKTTLFVPLLGGGDDRFALEMALQLVLRSPASMRAEVLVVEPAVGGDGEGAAGAGGGGETHASAGATHFTMTRGAGATTTGGGGGGREDALASSTADSVLLAHVEGLLTSSTSSSPSSGDSRYPTLPPGAVTVTRVTTARPLQAVLSHLNTLTSSSSSSSSSRVLPIIGRSRSRPSSSPSLLPTAQELRSLLSRAQTETPNRLSGNVVRSAEVRRAVGDVGSAVLLGSGGGEEGEMGGGRREVEGVWVVQAGGGGGGRRGRSA